MNYVHMYAGSDGETHFEEVELALQPDPRNPATSGAVAAPVEAQEIRWRQFAPGTDLGWHPAPRRQFVFILAGTVEITTSDGETRRLGPGSVFLADDLGSKGHRTRALDEGATMATLGCPSV